MKQGLVFFLVVLMGLSACMQSDGPSEAEVQAKRNLKSSGYNAQLGLGYLRQGNVQRAKMKLLTALKQNPNSPDVVGAMAYFLEKTGEPKKADNYYQSALRLTQGKGAQLNNYGAFLCRQGQYKKANRYFEQASKDMSYINSAGALENAGLCALAIPNKALAKVAFEKAIAQDSQRFQSTYQLAKIAYESKEYERTLSYIANYQKLGGVKKQLLELGLLTAKQLGQKEKIKNFEWLLNQRFPKSKKSKNSLASGQKNDKQKRTIS